MTKTDNTEALEALDELIEALPQNGLYDVEVKTIRAALTLQVPEGWQLVPKEPTEEMLGTGYEAHHVRDLNFDDVWCAMLAAAPVYGKEGG